MKTNVMILALIGLSFAACEKTDLPAKTMVGEWEWASSYYGFAPTLFTPQSEGYERQIEITETHFIQHQDGQEIRNEEYTVTTKEYESGSVVEFIEFNGYKTFIVELRSDSLLLWDTCADCYEHVYIRK